MSTPDAQNSHSSQRATSVPRRPHIVAPESPVPTTPFDDSMPSLDKEGTFFAASQTSESTTIPTSPLVSPGPSLLPAQPAQVMYPPSLKLPSINPNVPRTSLPPGSSLLDDNDDAENMPFEHAIDFATQSWDLATGGLKTMTAKRELPTRLDRKSLDLPPDESLDRSTRNYTFALIIMLCIILMLIGSGVVIFVLLQQ